MNLLGNQHFTYHKNCRESTRDPLILKIWKTIVCPTVTSSVVISVKKSKIDRLVRFWSFLTIFDRSTGHRVVKKLWLFTFSKSVIRGGSNYIRYVHFKVTWLILVFFDHLWPLHWSRSGQNIVGFSIFRIFESWPF